MRKALFRHFRLAPLPAITVCLAGVLLLASGAPSGRLFAGAGKFSGMDQRVPLIEDWSSYHLIYSAPRSLAENFILQQQPRYIQQYLRRYVLPQRPIARPIPGPIGRWRLPVDDLQRDWGLPVGSDLTDGEGNFPAKYVFDVTQAASCTADFVVFTTDSTSTTGTDIYGVNHLYVNSGGTGLCSGTAPTVLWSYHIQSQAGAADTSPVISYDGTQIAWIEGGGGKGVLHLLKPYTGGTDGTLAAPHTPTASTTAALYHTCTPAAPTGTTSKACLLNLTFANGDDDSGGSGAPISPSSPYYDYYGDTIYVGDDDGNLHEFTNVFNGSAAEVTTGGWPVATPPADGSVDADPALSGPVLDTTSGNVFVGNSSGRLFYVRLSSSTTGSCYTGSVPCVGATTFTDGNTANTKIASAPIVDSTTQRVFVFFGPNGGGPGAYVGQNNTSLSLATPPLVNVGTGTAHRLNAGTLDNEYYTTDNGLNQGTGWMYVCGNNGDNATTGNYALLQRIAVTNGVLGSAVDSTSWLASNASARCDPLTEFYNTPNATDYIFFGVEAAGATGTNCVGNGCVYAVTVTGGTLMVPVNPAPAGTGAVNASGGTSGIIVDNDSTSIGAASIYFTWLANGTGTATYPCNGATTTSVCAVKLTQSGLN
jgi:hypothetical protein